MKKIKLLSTTMLMAFLFSCVQAEKVVLSPAQAYSSPHFEITLQNGDKTELKVKNTSIEEKFRMQLDVEFLSGDEKTGGWQAMGLTMVSGDEMNYVLDLPEGTDKLKVHFKEIMYSKEADQDAMNSSLSKTGDFGVIYFNLN
jgi:hypothetical protein